MTDITLAKEHQNNFVDYLSANMTTKLGIDLTVTVLTTGFWPSYKTSDLNLPTEMVSLYFQILKQKRKDFLNSNILFVSGQLCCSF